LNDLKIIQTIVKKKLMRKLRKNNKIEISQKIIALKWKKGREVVIVS
jgi:hypothetical protein